MMRPLGRTGLAISPLTLGTGGLATVTLDRTEARAAFAIALAGGINAIELAIDDAAAVAFVADLLRETPHRVHILARAAASVPFDLPSPHVLADAAYPGAALRRQVEALLAALGIERLALLQLHAWCPEWLHEGDWREAVVALRQEGKLAGIGVSLFDHDMEAGMEAVARQAVDAVQVMHNVFDPAARDRLYPLAHARQVAVIARAPLYYGALAQPPFAGGVEGWRADYFYPEHRTETIARVARVADAAPGPVARTALRYALSDPVVTTLAVGMRTRAHVAANLAAVADGPLDAGAVARLASHRWLC